MRDMLRRDGYFVWQNQDGRHLKPYKLHVNIEEENFALHFQDLIELVRREVDAVCDSIVQFKCVDIESERSKNFALFIKAYRLLYSGFSALGKGDRAVALCASLEKLREISKDLDDDSLNSYIDEIENIQKHPEIIAKLDLTAVEEYKERCGKKLQLWERAVGRGQLTLYFSEDADEMAIVEFCGHLESALQGSQLQATPAEQGPPQFDLGLSSFLSLRLDTDEYGNYIAAEQLGQAGALQEELGRLPIYLKLREHFESLGPKFSP